MALLALVVCLGACAKATPGKPTEGASVMGWVPWQKKEDTLVSSLERKQDASLARLTQQRALEQAIVEAQAREAERSRRSRVPPSMYRTTEPPLPEPDFSLPVQEVPRSSPTPSAR
jgi:hypothetical protein